jgi:hypothetical protein
LFSFPKVVSGSKRFGPLAGEMRHPLGPLPGATRRLSGPIGGAQALVLRQEGATPRRRHPLRAELPGIGQLAPHSAVLG